MQNPLFIGKLAEHLTEVGSTNSFLQHWSNIQYLPEGTVVTADFQHLGRGQRGTSWQSAPGENILASVLFYPDFLAPDQQFYLNFAIALGVLEFIQQQVPDYKALIKWPNDIWVEKKKIAGILIESSIQGNKLKTSIAGIGVNVNLKEKNFPGATSISGLNNKNYDVKHFLEPLYMALEKNYVDLKQGHKQMLYNKYCNNLYGFGQPLNFIEAATGKQFAGTITGVDSNGKLCVKTEKADLHFGIKELIFL